MRERVADLPRRCHAEAGSRVRERFIESRATDCSRTIPFFLKLSRLHAGILDIGTQGS
jgi:hypothetical protein